MEGVRQRISAWAAARGRRALCDLGFAAGLFVLIAAAYAPARHHAPRADQWSYLADTAECRTFADLLGESYSYNRTRRIGPGDTDLFRPILFVLLAVEKQLFGPGDFRSPQAVGVGLHYAVCLLLLALLRTIATAARPADPARGIDPLPYAVTAFFALNPCVQELVIWAHLQGYVLFLAQLLASLTLLIRHATGPASGSWRSPALLGAWSVALLSAFTYELGQVYAVLAGLFLAAAVAPRVGAGRAVGLFAAFAGIALAYQTTNAIDRRVHEGRYGPDVNRHLMWERALTPATVEHTGRFVAYTTGQPFFPSLVHSDFGPGADRLHIPESLWAGYGLRVFTPVLVCSLAVVGLGLGLGMAGLCRLARTGGRVPRLLFLLVAGLYGAYAAATVLGRLNVRPGPFALASNCYYAYPGLLLALVTLAAAWEAAGRRATQLRVALALGLVILTAAGAEHVRAVNEKMARELKEYTQPIRAVQMFVLEHRDEPGFRFAIDYAASDPIPKAFEVPIPDVIFARWIGPDPGYRLVVREGKVLVQSGPGEGPACGVATP
jgi:hypothetical protein